LLPSRSAAAAANTALQKLVDFFVQLVDFVFKVFAVLLASTYRQSGSSGENRDKLVILQ
jgi:hypothetical protein